MAINILTQKASSQDCSQQFIGVATNHHRYVTTYRNNRNVLTYFRSFDSYRAYAPYPSFESSKVILVKNFFPNPQAVSIALRDLPVYSPVLCQPTEELTSWPKELLDKLTLVDMGVLEKFNYDISVGTPYNKERLTCDLYNVSSCAVDAVASLSLFNSSFKDRFLAAAPNNLEVIHLNNPFKGGSGAGLCGADDKFKTVSKEFVTNNICIFAYKAKFDVVIDWREEDPIAEEKEVICLGMFIEKDIFYKYRRIIDFLTAFKSYLLNRSALYLNYTEYLEKLQKDFGRIGAYWPVLMEICQASPNKNNVEDFVQDLQRPTEYKYLGLLELTSVMRASARASLPTFADYMAFKKHILKKQDEANTLRQRTISITKSINDSNNGITYYLQRIEQYKSEIESYTKQAAACVAQATDIETVIPEMFIELASKKELMEITLNSNDNNFNESIKQIITALEEQYHIRITTLELKDGEKTYTIQPGTVIPEIDTYSIERIELITLRPNLIYVDKNGNKQRDIRVGGPYRIEAVRHNGMSIALLNLSSICGIQDMNAKVHPHTGATRINKQNILSSIKNNLVDFSARCCLGNAEIPLYEAMKNGNIKITIVNILNYLQNANSSDTWGSQYTWFPKPKEVNFDPDWENLKVFEPSVKLTTEADIDELIAQAIDTLENP